MNYLRVQFRTGVWTLRSTGIAFLALLVIATLWSQFPVLVSSSSLSLFLTMSVNKALQMDPYVSRLIYPVTEYLASQGSSSCSSGHWPGMDTAIILLALKQGTQSLENYILSFLAIAYYSDLLDIILIEFICDGINQPLKSKLRCEGPRSSLCQFLDYALLSVGSLFTVGVAEEERDIMVMAAAKFSQPQAPGHSSILIATPVNQPAREILAAPEHARIMAATAEPVLKMAASTTPRHVTAAIPESNQVKSLLLFLSQVKSQLLFLSQVKSQLIFLSQVKSQLIFLSQVMSQLLFMSQVKSQLFVESRPESF